MEKSENKKKIEWTFYLACAYAEGFGEGENATLDERMEAWSFIAVNELWRGLQGWYGRMVADLKRQGLLEENGDVNWDNVEFNKQYTT